MPATVIWGCFLIIVARVADVTLGTLRTAAIIQGRRLLAFMLGFVEMLIWVTVVLKLLATLESPFYLISYAIGFGLGNYMGITVESWIGFGERVVQLFTRKSDAAAKLRKVGYRVTQLEGTGRDGTVYVLYSKMTRREVPGILKAIAKIDPDSFHVIADVRSSSPSHYPTGWRNIAKKK